MADKPPKRDKDVIPYQAFSGLRNNVPSHRFGPSDLEVATNIDLDDTGAISLRRGATQVRTGAPHSGWSDNRTCLYVDGGVLKQLNANYSAAALKTLASNARASFCKVNDCIYFGNGVDAGVLQNGAVRSWGLPVPPMVHADVTVGQMPAGDYQFALTYLRDDGQESGAGLATRVTVPEGGGLIFTLPVGADPGIAAKSLYLSTPNGKTMFRAFTVANSVTGVSYTNDTRELNTDELLETQGHVAAPAGHLVAYYGGQMFVAVDDTLYPSIEYAHERFDLSKYFTFDGRITMIAPLESEGLFVATDKSTGWLPGTGASAFRYVERAQAGAIVGALDYIKGTHFGDGTNGTRLLPMWLATDGICIGLPGGQVLNLTDSKFSFTAQGSGCALFRGDTSQLIAVANH